MRFDMHGRSSRPVRSHGGGNGSGGGRFVCAYMRTMRLHFREVRFLAPNRPSLEKSLILADRAVESALNTVALITHHVPLLVHYATPLVVISIEHKQEPALTLAIN